MIDPVENNFFGLPEYEHTRDETFQPLPPPGSPGSAEDALPNGGNYSLDNWNVMHLFVNKPYNIPWEWIGYAQMVGRAQGNQEF